MTPAQRVRLWRLQKLSLEALCLSVRRGTRLAYPFTMPAALSWLLTVRAATPTPWVALSCLAIAVEPPAGCVKAMLAASAIRTAESFFFLPRPGLSTTDEVSL